jgi:hypothetical protein
MLIESPLSETEDQFCAYVAALLESIYGHLPKWMEFRVGGVLEWKGVCYREFCCPAGSVAGRIQLHATTAGGISRGIILRGMLHDTPCCWEIRKGVETQFACAELTPL